MSFGLWTRSYKEWDLTYKIIGEIFNLYEPKIHIVS
jgi:hypothetical protein